MSQAVELPGSIKKNLSPISRGSGDEACQICTRCEAPNFFCVDCGLTFCNDCWHATPAHAPGVFNRDGMPHEMINKHVASRLNKIFTVSNDPVRQRELHETDAETTWFGVTRNATGSPVLQDYGRYSTIMRNSHTGDYPQRWPQLVSFVGQTGSGKSTLVKLLVDYQERNKNLKKAQSAEEFPSPVAGSINSHATTSGDVHLYADPASYHTQFPILYADCEGMGGGERVPIGARYKHHDLSAPKSKSRHTSTETQSSYKIPQKVRKLNKAVKREIRWASTPETCKREFAVRHLYPRLLYAFSDIVVFVLRNDREFESGTLVPMLQWAASSIEGSLNQSAMPHAIILLNFTDPNIDPSGWTIKSATNSLLKEHAQAVVDNPSVRSRAQYWEQKGKHIATTKDLLECYYSSVSVVRVPLKGLWGLLDQQVGELTQHIQKVCSDARDNRKRLRVNFDTEEFQAALSMGFDHFSNRLDEPFDFVELSWKLNPIPKDFGGNILRLALAIKADRKMAGASGPEIFLHLGHMVASCVMLDYVRHHIKGSAARLLEEHYKESYSRALKEFCEDWWPCSYVSEKGFRCVNTFRGHIRGHQDSKGRLLATGTYQTDDGFTEKGFENEWSSTLKEMLNRIREQMDRATGSATGSAGMNEEKAAEELHLKRMNEFYSNLGDDLSSYMNHSACFCCLRELPEHALPCGHVICTPCVRSFARKKNRVAYALDSCPLHEHEMWEQEWEIPVKPPLAGVRVLTLDGGGIRGIVELKVLAEIQKHLGGLPINNFFDLVVGTSTGGLIALGLGVKNWSVESCTKQFGELVSQAFTPREFNGVPLFEQLTTLNHKGKYKTKPFKAALQKCFNEDQLFGGVCDEARYQRKVAVVSVSETGQQAVILTNYNRLRRGAEPDYKFERPEKSTAELKIWEACRATSAATGYFKPFENDRTGVTYIDGALYYNNPVRVANQERKLLWPDVDTQPPDIMLSIGTGCSPEAKTNGSSWTSWLKPQFFQVAVNRFDNILDAQNAWDQFYHDVREPHSSLNSRYVRLNPELKSKVKLDDVKSFLELKGHVTQCLQTHKWRSDAKAVASRLIASSFFFEKDPNHESENNIHGWIHCRFPDESPELRLLGHYFQGLLTAHFSPYFMTTEQHQKDSGTPTLITKGIITSMIQESTFKVEKLTIDLSSKLAKTMISLCLDRGCEEYPISGFPRHLVIDESTEDAARQAQLQASKLYGSVKSEGDASTANNNSPTPSSSSSTGETSFWTRSHFKPKPGISALRKNGTGIEDTVASPTERTTLGSLFGRSQISLPPRTRTEPRPRPKSSEDVRPLLLSKATTPDALHSRPGRQALKNSSKPLLHPSHSVRVRGPGHDVSPSPTSRLVSQEYLEERRDLHESRSMSLHSESSSVLQAWSTDPLSASPPVPPMPTMTPAHTTSRQMNQPTQQNEASLLRRLEGMTDEERLELAIQESKKDAAPAIHDPPRQNTTRSPFTSFSRGESSYTTHPPTSREASFPRQISRELAQREVPVLMSNMPWSPLSPPSTVQEMPRGQSSLGWPSQNEDLYAADDTPAPAPAPTPTVSRNEVESMEDEIFAMVLEQSKTIF